MLKQRVETLLNAFLDSRTDLFLIEWNLSDSGHIRVILDGDQGVTLQDCIDASRQIEHNLNEDDDFSLEVTSAGATSPLILPRQYKKNKGRDLELTLLSGNHLTGKLIEADENEVTILSKVREPKPLGKGKITVEKETSIPFSEIAKSTVKLNFK
ncbi:MAG: ribosome assembly cofactor RimP [Flavobacteriaceae bacterium]|nr:ribosome assembly cofactor RimP [Flavobacteriaceae bacterium]